MKKHRMIFYSLILSIVVLVGQSINSNFKVEAQPISLTPNLSSSAYNSNNIFTACGYKGQCTWFTYGRVLEKLNIKLPSEFYGNAIDWWGSNIKDKVYQYGLEPKADSIIVWSGGRYGYGHVGYVEKVVGDLIYFNEGDFSVRGNYDGYVKTISKEAIKNRGNIFLKGYIYVKEKYGTLINNVNTNANQNNNIISYGQINLSNKSSSLSVRKGTGTSFNIIGTLSNKSNVNIVEKSGNWYKIQFANSTGYICADYVKILSLVNNKTTSQKATIIIKTGIVKLSDKNSKLNVRVTPSGAVSDILSQGNKVNIVGQNGNFYQITCGKIKGYVSVKYISIL